MAAAAAAGNGKPSPTSSQQQPQPQPALFAAKHRELVAEAAGVAREFGANVTTVAFLPGAGPARAVRHQFRGGGAAAAGANRDALEVIRSVVARDVSAMAPADAAAHLARLSALRGAVEKKLEEKKMKQQQQLAAGRGGKAVKRAPEQQQEALAAGKVARLG
ncbi:hypothetical protein ACP4OV_018244 [Aristida adscensionis]